MFAWSYLEVVEIDKEAILNYLFKHPEHADILRRAVEVEEKHSGDGHWLGWEWHEVRVHTGTINKLIIEGLVRVTYSSSSTTNYKLTDLEATKEALREFDAFVERSQEAEEGVEIPPDLFDAIVGYDDIKQLFLDAIRSSRPCHILLCGPPASAKSLFLLELDRLPGSRYLIGGQTTKVGIAEEVFEHRPRYLIIDEIDDMPVSEQSVLKSLMWSGVISIRKHNVRLKETFNTWVFAACNNPEKLSDAVKSRFLKVYFQPYTFEQFKEVVVTVLTKRENVERGLAEYIADRVGKYTRDPREAINLARIASTKEKVDKYVELFWGKKMQQKSPDRST
jgi:DNA replicative helicase MCM subunit Mcm2 (Cdc46/Mcm family)